MLVSPAPIVAYIVCFTYLDSSTIKSQLPELVHSFTRSKHGDRTHPCRIVVHFLVWWVSRPSGLTKISRLLSSHLVPLCWFGVQLASVGIRWVLGLLLLWPYRHLFHALQLPGHILLDLCLLSHLVCVFLARPKLFLVSRWIEFQRCAPVFDSVVWFP